MKQVLLLLLCAIAAIQAAQSAVHPEEFPTLHGWTLATDTIVYTPENLWDLIDGAAESYITYGFVELHVATYTGSQNMEVRAEVYRHSSSENAFGIYALERAPEYDFIDVGTQGYTEEGILNFLAGMYYVKLSTHRPGREAQPALGMIAEAIQHHLAQPLTWPPVLQLLPTEGRQRNTEGYVASNFLGYSFLTAAFTARYGETPGCQLFIIHYPSAERAWDALQKMLDAAGKGTNAGANEGTILLDDPNNGPLLLMVRDAYLAGVIDCGEPHQREKYVTLLAKSIEPAPR